MFIYVMALKSAVISGVVLILFGSALIYFIDDLVAYVYGGIAVIVGIALFLNTREDKIEQIKNATLSNSHEGKNTKRGKK
ncbi:MAG: hypothetical protein ACI83O_000436 [Patescibacteria group bacterium]|jgi:hypothetical protein